MMFEETILAWILFFPVAAALVVSLDSQSPPAVDPMDCVDCQPDPFAMTVFAWLRFDPAVNPSAPFQFELNYVWYEAIHSTFHLGVDGISLAMVLTNY